MTESQNITPEYLAQDIGHRAVTTSTAFLIIDTIFVALRFLSRRLQLQKLNWDDWILIPSLLLVTGTATIGYLGVEYTVLGRHIEYAAQYPDKVVYFYKLFLIALPAVYVVSMSLPKLSILGLYLHILRDRISRIVVYATMFAITVNCLVTFILNLHKCDPISYGWKSLLGEHVPGAWCVNPQPLFVWGSLINIITDVVVVLLPIPMIYRLHTNKTTKFGLATLFGLGSAGIIASCMRFAAFYSTEALKDSSWSSVELFIWCLGEPSIYLMAACMLAFGPLLSRTWEALRNLVSKYWFKREKSSETAVPDSDRAGGLHGHEKRSTRKWLSFTDFSTIQTSSDHLGGIVPEDLSKPPKSVIYMTRSFDVESCALTDNCRHQPLNQPRFDLMYGYERPLETTTRPEPSHHHVAEEV